LPSRHTLKRLPSTRRSTSRCIWSASSLVGASSRARMPPPAMGCRRRDKVGMTLSLVVVAAAAAMVEVIWWWIEMDTIIRYRRKTCGGNA
jgi:hypothetical protein